DGLRGLKFKWYPRLHQRTFLRRRAAILRGGVSSNPVESTLLVCPHVSDRQNHQKHRDFGDAKPAELAITDGPREQEDGLHVEDDEQNGDDVETDGIPAPGIA